MFCGTQSTMGKKFYFRYNCVLHLLECFLFRVGPFALSAVFRTLLALLRKKKSFMPTDSVQAALFLLNICYCGKFPSLNGIRQGQVSLTICPTFCLLCATVNSNVPFPAAPLSALSKGIYKCQWLF